MLLNKFVTQNYKLVTLMLLIIFKIKCIMKDFF